jgi:hypothetical protein
MKPISLSSRLGSVSTVGKLWTVLFCVIERTDLTDTYRKPERKTGLGWVWGAPPCKGVFLLIVNTRAYKNFPGKNSRENEGGII